MSYVPSSQFPKLDTLLNTMNTLQQSRKQQTHLVNQPMQMQMLSRASGKPVLTSHDMGPTLMTFHKQPPTPNASQSLFMSNYLNQNSAVQDLQSSRNHVQQVQQQVQQVGGYHTTEALNESQCHVYPPLLVRYDDPQSPIDRYVPVEIVAGGELHRAKGVPDLILNFHIDSHAITATTCHINPEKLKNFEIAIWTLYSMHMPDPNTMLTVSQFTAEYDQTRYRLIKTLAAKAGRV